jgi:hypothetical protein
MRARNIKPSLFKNELLGDADPVYTILFEGLWCMADREGRLEDRPKRIQAEILPYRPGANTMQALCWLHSNGFISRYEVEGTGYIQVVKFKEHQNPHIKEAKSVIPDISVASTVLAPDEHQTSTMQAPDKHHTSPADSLNLIPDVMIPDPLNLNPEAPSVPAAGLAPTGPVSSSAKEALPSSVSGTPKPIGKSKIPISPINGDLMKNWITTTFLSLMVKYPDTIFVKANKWNEEYLDTAIAMDPHMYIKTQLGFAYIDSNDSCRQGHSIQPNGKKGWNEDFNRLFEDGAQHLNQLVGKHLLKPKVVMTKDQDYIIMRYNSDYPKHGVAYNSPDFLVFGHPNFKTLAEAQSALAEISRTPFEPSKWFPMYEVA